MLEQLTAWADDDGVATVLVHGAGERGLCAGGDIVAIYQDMLQAEGTGPRTSGSAEYRLNSLIAGYPKPYVAFMDGLVLGGGVGISAHGSVRVVTERTRTGMPETTIGFVPDVGGTWLLSRSPGEAGTHAALTGAHLSGADALFLGLADHFVPSGSLPALAAALESETAEAAVGRFAEQPPASALEAQRGLDRRLLRERRRGGDRPPAAGRRAGMPAERRRRPPHHRGEVAHGREGGAGVAAPGQGPDAGGGPGAGIPGGAAVPGRPGFPRRASGRRWWTRTATRGGSRPPCTRCARPTSSGYFAPLGDRELNLQRKGARQCLKQRTCGNTIAFLGLGHMGGPMAVNLVKAGYTRGGLRRGARGPGGGPGPRCPHCGQPCRGRGRGRRGAHHVPQRPARAGCLPRGGRAPGLLAAAAPGTMFLDCSTINVDEAREAAALAVAAGHRSVDAPVSGGVVGAEAGTLTFMVGGAARGLRRRAAAAGGDGQARGPLRRARRRPGREDLQQPHPGRLHDRGERGLRAGREAGADAPGAVRRRLRRVRAVLGAHHQLPRSGAGPHQPGQPRLPAGICRGADGQGPQTGPERAAEHRGGGPAGPAGLGNLRYVCR